MRAHHFPREPLGELRLEPRDLADAEFVEGHRAERELIAKFKVERPEIVARDFEQYARLLNAAKAEDEDWFAGVCLAGEAGLRVGEIKALKWREDVDMIARTLHALRHTFGTHAGLFGVNPWRLQTWLGHKRIDETTLHVHVAENHARELPENIREAARGEEDLDRRILAMLGARGSIRGKGVAKTAGAMSASGKKSAG